MASKAVSYLKSAGGWLKRNWKRIVVSILVLIIIGVSGFAWYFSNPHQGEEDDLNAVMSDDEIEIKEYKSGFVMSPRGSEADTALIYYPGARVHPESYLYNLAPMVKEKNIKVFVPGMFLNLAVLDVGKANGIIKDNPDIENWYIGGHSLGGAMSCTYASNNKGKLEGVLLFAAYCADDISNSSLDVLAVTGTKDGVLNREKFRKNKAKLPENTEFAVIDGMNHSQFGNYGGQSGDNPSNLTDKEVRKRFSETVINWFEKVREDSEDTKSSILFDERGEDVSLDFSEVFRDRAGSASEFLG